MALPLSGPISMSQINTELSLPATTLISLNQSTARSLAGVPAGMISLSNFYGKSNVLLANVMGAQPQPAAGQPVVAQGFYTNLSTLTATLIPMVGRVGSYTNGPDYTLIMAGVTGQPITTTDGVVSKFSYPTQTSSPNIGILQVGRSQASAGGDGTKAYVTGGSTYNGGPVTPGPVITLKYVFSTNTPSTVANSPTPSPGAQRTKIYDATKLIRMSSNSLNTSLSLPYATETWVGPVAQPLYTAPTQSGSGANNSAGSVSYQTVGGPTGAIQKFTLPTNTYVAYGTTPAPAFTGGASSAPNYGLFQGLGPIPTRGNARLTYSYITETFVSQPNLPTPWNAVAGQPSGIMV